MTSDPLQDIYRKLAFSRGQPEESFLVLDELAENYRSQTNVGCTSEKWLGDADYCLHEIAQSSPLFVAAVSRWLTADEYIDLALALLEKASVQHLQQEIPESYDLSGIEESLAILVACRLCARGYTAPAVTLGWALSLATSLPVTERTREAVDHLLQHHIEEYPSTTGQLLSHEDSPFKSLEPARKAIELLEKQERWLQDLPKLREFSMTPEMRLTLSSLKRRQNRDLNRRSQERSIFSIVCTSYHFKYANRTALEVAHEDQIQETTLNMSPFSVAIEMPLSELTDPMSGRFQRRTLWGGLHR